MSVYRVRFAVAGAHVHCRLFCAPQSNTTWAKCGDFVVRRGEEFRSLVRSFSEADFLGDDEAVGIEAALRNE
jgi:hypothetical protein